jgi:hypothetical protein
LKLSGRKSTDANFHDRTLSALETALSFDDAVLYAVLHEAIYCEGEASDWAAERVGKGLREFQWLSGSPQSASSVREAPLFFSGEMIFSFLFDIFPELGKLAPVADIIAKFPNWPELYDQWQLVSEIRSLRFPMLGETNDNSGSQ